MKVLGMTSGTSHDGIDLAAVDFTLSGDGLYGAASYVDTVPLSPPQVDRQGAVQ